jgi:translocation and assembly module TamB
MTNNTSLQSGKSRRWLIRLLACIITLSAGVSWLLATTSGLHFVTALMAPGVTVSEVNGTLLGPMSAKTLNIDQAELHLTIRDIRLDWQPDALLRGAFEITTLAAGNVEVISRTSTAPSVYPDKLRLPLALSVQKINIDTLQIRDKQGVVFSARDMKASLSSDGRLHRVAYFNARLDVGQLTASGQLDGDRPFAVTAQAQLAGLTDFTGIAGNVAHISSVVSGNLTKLAIHAQGSGGGLGANADVALTPYAPSPIATLNITATGLNPQAFSQNLPLADLALRADFSGDATGQLTGNVSASNLSPAPWDHNGLPLQGMSAHATLSQELVQLDNLTLAFAKHASISGNISWQRKKKTGLADMIISGLDPAALNTQLRAAKLNGSIKLSGDSKALSGVLSLSDNTLHLDAHVTKTGNTITLDKLVLLRDKAALTGDGHWQLDKDQAYKFNGSLHRFDLAAFIQAQHSDLNATLDLSGNLVPHPAGMLNFMMNHSRLDGQAVSGNGKIMFADTCLVSIDSELRLGDNRLRTTGGLCGKTLQVDLKAPKLEQAGLGGELTAHASLAGTVARPQISFAAAGRNLRLPGGRELTSIDATGALKGEALNLSMTAANYHTQAKTQVASLQVTVLGSLTHHELITQIKLDKDNMLTLAATGGFDDLMQKPANWQGALTELSGTGALPFTLLSAAPLQIESNHLMLGKAELSVAGGKLHINGVDWTPQRLSSQGGLTGIGLRMLSQKPADVLRIGGVWNIDSAKQSSLHIARESGDWLLPDEQPLGLRTLEFTARAVNGQLTGELTAQGTRSGEWHAHLATLVIKSAYGYRVPDKAPLTGHLGINVPDLAWLGSIIGDNFKTGGNLALQADITGSIASPALHGQVHGDNLAIALLDQGIRLQQGQLLAHFDKKSLFIDALNFIAPIDPKPKDVLLIGLNADNKAGQISATGVIGPDGKSGNLDIIASHLPLSQRPDRWIIASGNGHVRLNNNHLMLGGILTADAGLISQSINGRPQLSDDVVIAGQPATTRKGTQLSVDAKLDLGEHFYLRASGLEARLVGQLAVRDEQGLSVTGSIATREAKFDAYGQKLTVQRGIVNFQGSLYDPGLNILAVRQGLSVEAGVTVTGTARHPVIKLVSTPDVPDVEKLSWIVQGRAPGSTGGDTALLLSAAGGILGEGSGGISTQLKQALGVDEISLSQDVSSPAASNNPLSSQIVTVGKRISSRAFISYSQGVTAVAGITKLTYTLTPRVNIVTQAGMDNAIDIFYTFSFN